MSTKVFSTDDGNAADQYSGAVDFGPIGYGQRLMEGINVAIGAADVHNVVRHGRRGKNRLNR